MRRGKAALPAVARLAALTERWARHLIQGSWWRGIPFDLPLSTIPDQSWDWVAMARRGAESDDFVNYVALTCDHNRLEAQGAIACDFRGTSIREPGRPVVYLQYLASAPRNRLSIMGEDRVFRGIGTSLAEIAVYDSFRAGFGGRVLLQPLAESIWLYESLSFQKAIDVSNGRLYYEISDADAISLLRARGWI